METTGVIWRLLLLLLLVAGAQCARGYEADDETTAQPEDNVTRETTAVATTSGSFRHPRWYKRGDHDAEDDHDDHHDDEEDMDHVDSGETKALAGSKGDVWGGYYDFLINEGSYKFWAVFQLATAGLLIYSGFAALYYAKVNPSTTDDYEDYFLRRRRRRRRDVFLGLGPETFQRIIDAVSGEFPPQPTG